MSDYIIERVSQQPPREWYDKAHNSTIYYHNVVLQGHSKPVSIGKKIANSLKVGDTVSGTINPDPGTTDKFKSAPLVQGGFGGGAAPASTGSTYKDNSDGQRQGMCFNNAASFIGITYSGGLGAPKWAELVYEYANALYKLGDLGKPLDTSTDPMDAVHRQNPVAIVEDEFGQTENFDTSDLPPDF